MTESNSESLGSKRKTLATEKVKGLFEKKQPRKSVFFLNCFIGF